MSRKNEVLDSEQSLGSCIPSFVQVVVGQGFSFSPSSDPQKSSTEAAAEVHLRALCLLPQQKARLGVMAAGIINAGCTAAVPRGTSAASALLRAQISRRLREASSGAGSDEATAALHPAPPPSLQVITRGRSPPTRPRCSRHPRGRQPCGVQDARHLHVPCCNLRCIPAPAGAMGLSRAAWLMSGATSSPPTHC